MSSPSPLSFMENLWTSVFVPGTTPTLLLATNASLAALQVVLLALLLTTHSIHFLFLSMISAGLWISINWFVREAGLLSTEAEKKQMATTTATAAATKTTTTTSTTTIIDGAPGDTANVAEDEVEERTKATVDGDQRTEKDHQDAVPQMTRPMPAPFSNRPPGAFPMSDDSDIASPRATSPALEKQETEVSGGHSSSEDSEWEKVDQEEAT